MPQDEMVSSSHSGIHSAWLTKVKGDGAKAKWIQSSGRRYFTIDFDSQILYYGHTMTDKRISAPIPFKEIVSAVMDQPLRPSVAHDQAVQRGRKGSIRTAWSRQADAVAFVLQTRNKRIQLEAESESDAFAWVDMLTTAHRLGRGEAVGGPGLRAGQDLGHVTCTDSSPLYSRDSSNARSGTTSPTELQSNATTAAESRSTTPTTEGSMSTEPYSPATWSDAEVASSAATPLSPASLQPAMETAAKQVEAAAEALSAPSRTSSTDSVPKPFLASPTEHRGAAQSTTSAARQPTWQAATLAAAAEEPSFSSSGRLQLQVADFGFGASESEQGSCTRDSSPDSVTISPRLHAGGPGRDTLRIEHTVVLDESAMHKSSTAQRAEQALSFDRSGDDDDNSDMEVVCEVRDRRNALDLELVTQAQARKARLARPTSSSGTGEEKSEERHPQIDASPQTSTSAARSVNASHVGEAEDIERGAEKCAAARIAADLELLRKPGRASSASVIAAAAPPRQELRMHSEGDADEEKARRRAARRAAKEAANGIEAQEAAAEHVEAVDEEKARRRAARKAAKEAARSLESLETDRQQQPEATRSVKEPIEAEVSVEEAKARRRAARRAAKEAAGNLESEKIAS